MSRPKMILFDYGHTLLHEDDFSPLAGERALFRYVTKNPLGLTPESACEFSDALFRSLSTAKEANLEIHEFSGLRLKNELLGLAYSISLEKAERVLWDGMSPGSLMPDADWMLDEIASRGIRSGVISNIGWSGGALTERLDRLLPRNRFEFVIASSEYAVRKPNPLLFQLALRKAELEAGEVWFCGDNPVADVEGSYGAGLYPVWYDNTEVRDQPGWVRPAPPKCPHLHIRHWSELIDALDAVEA